MPTFCRADKKPASSAVASSGSAYAGAAAAITTPTPSAASSAFITCPFFPSVEKPCQLSCCGQVLTRLNHVVPYPNCESDGTTLALPPFRCTAWTPGFLASCSSRLSRPSWSTVWCCTLSGFSDICATKRFSCSGDWLPLRSLSGVRRPRTPLLATTVGAPAPIALPSIPAAGIELNMLPSAIAAGDTASGPAADNAAATVLTVGVAVAQLGGNDSFPTKVPELPMSADTELVSQPRPHQGPVSPPPRPSFGIAPNPGAGVNFRNCDTGKLVSSPRSLNPVVKLSGVLTALKSAVNVDAPFDPNRLFSRPLRVSV